MEAYEKHNQCSGFTLIELSIVLVIIGLIVGGVLAGQNLIAAAQVRATVSQVEKYNTAVNTFKGKYGNLPGDLTQKDVTAFGFTGAPTRQGGQGWGDGNGIIEGRTYTQGIYPGIQAGEVIWFWEDLSTNSQLIEGGFSSAADYNLSFTDPTPYLPQAKVNSTFSVYVYANNSLNYYGLCTVNSNVAGYMTNTASLTVAQAYAIDAKIDDGLPTTGKVLAQYTSGNIVRLPSSAVNSSATTCYTTTGPAYSVNFKNGANSNCALSFGFQ